MSSRPRRGWTRYAVIGAALAVAVALAGAVTLHAHPASDTSVVIALREGRTLEVCISSDASALVTKLEVLAGEPMSSALSRTALVARLISLGTTLSAHTALTLDGQRLALRSESATVDERGIATLRLTSPLTARAQSMSWSTDLMYGTYPLVLRREDGQEAVRWIDASAPSGPILLRDLTHSPVSALAGLRLGFTHIVPKGLDHILFVLGLFLLCPVVPKVRWRTRNPEPTAFRLLLFQITAFTLAHSVTLGLSLYGIVRAPGEIVEPLIALSVAYVGVENLFTSRLRPSRVLIVFAFGLLHGLGFASAMSELPYSHADLIRMLVTFNIGVELGQLSVIAAATLVMGAVWSYRETWQRPTARFGSALVGAMGLLWMVERLGA